MSSNLFRKAIREVLDQPTTFPKGKISITYADGPGKGFRSSFYSMTLDVPGSSPKSIRNQEQANHFLQRTAKVYTPIPEGMQDREGLAALKVELNAMGYDFSVFEMDVS